VTPTRNYGETASEKSNELLLHMLVAILSGRRAHLADTWPPGIRALSRIADSRSPSP
jgi:hypothetical protein